MRPIDLTRLFVLAAVWGASFLFMRVAAPVLGPVLLIALRVTLAGLVLFVYSTATQQYLNLRAYWRQYLIIGAVNSAIPFVLIATAELHLSASLAAILNAASPLFSALFAVVLTDERLGPRKLAGIALGFVGVVLVVGWSPLVLSRATLLSVGASLLAAACYALAGIYTKTKAAGAPALGMAVGSQLGASLLLLPLVPLTLPRILPGATVILCVLGLGLLSTALAYVLYFRLLVDTGAVKALTVTFLVPVFGTLWGTLFLRERLTAGTLLGCGVILAGMALVTGLRIGMPHRLLLRRAGADSDGH